GVFNPKRVEAKPILPTLSITQISVRHKGGERNLPLDAQPLQVGWHDSQLSIQARVFSYIDPAANQYRFRLNGFDADWVDRENHGEREFTGLGSGDYTLDIMARGADGRWGSPGAPPRTHVQSPPWLRWWAWLIYAGLIVGVAFLSLLAWR